MKKIFKQRYAKLFSGERVKAGDKVSFIDSDGVKRIGFIQYDPNNRKRLFFWNSAFEIKDYQNAKKEIL